MSRLVRILPFFALWVAPYAWSAETPVDPSGYCFESMPSRPEFQVLKGKVPFGGATNATLEMLASTKKPTAPEKAALSALATASAECMRLGATWRGENYPPTVNSMIERFTVASKARMADLYAGKITYGDFARTASTAEAQFKAEVAEEVQRLVAARKAQLDQQAEAEKRRQQEVADRDQAAEAEKAQQDAQIRAQAALQEEQYKAQAALQEQQNEEARRSAALMMLMNQKPYMLPMPQPRPPVNCQSFVSGNTVQTRCY